MSLSNRLKAGSEEICAIGRRMLGCGLVVGSWGNISLRRSDTMLITPSGMDYDDVTPSDIVAIDLVSGKTTGFRKPSSESKMHQAIYDQRPDVFAIVHTHSVYAGVLAVTHTPLPPVLEELAQTAGGMVGVADYALAGTGELAGNATDALAEKGAVLLANHGLVAVGRNLAEAFYTAHVVERAAQVYVFSRQLGTPKVIPDSDVQILRQGYLFAYRKIDTLKGKDRP